MKTPRELLLARHRAAEDKLDAVRREVLRASAQPSRETREQAAIVSPPLRRDPWRHLPLFIWIRTRLEMPGPLRWHLTGLGAVWLLIVLTKVATPGGPQGRATPTASSASGDQQMAMAEKQKLLAELADSPAPQPAQAPQSFAPRPRSEYRTHQAAV